MASGVGQLLDGELDPLHSMKTLTVKLRHSIVETRGCSRIRVLFAVDQSVGESVA